jgi:magnesium chelatase family protein
MVLGALERAMVTARGARRLERISRTIANLAGSERVTEDHVAEAMSLRSEW